MTILNRFVVRPFLFVVLFALLSEAASAATVGYWRFEDSPGFLQDSSGNGHHITGGGLTEGTHQTTIPGSGDGSAFPATIPLTGAPNTSYINNAASRYGTVPDDNAFTPGAFTVEAFLNRDSGAGFRLFASQWTSTPASRSWATGLTNTGDTERLTLLLGNVTGSSFTTFKAPTTDFDLALDKDYYVALSWDGALTGSGNAGIKFYIKNLTDDTALVMGSVDHSISTLHNSSSAVALGANSPTNQNPWVGLLDEIRFSNTALSANELLIFQTPVVEVAPVPEPSSFVLAGLGILLLKRRRRQQR